MSQFSWFVSNYRLMNNRPKVFTRTWNSMNRFFRCLPFIDSHINDHCGINQNAVELTFYFQCWKNILSEPKGRKCWLLRAVSFEEKSEVNFHSCGNFFFIFISIFFTTLIKWWCGWAWWRWHRLLLHIHNSVSSDFCTYW